VYDAPDAPSRKLKALYRELDELRELLKISGTPRELKEKIEQQVRLYEKTLEQ
jgi:hypothetical protein